MVHLHFILSLPCWIFEEGVDMGSDVLYGKLYVLSDDIMKISIRDVNKYDVCSR